MNTVPAILVLGLAAGTACADLVDPLVPDWRGDANAEYAGWESFTNANGGPNFPEEGSGFSLFNFGPGGIIASSGNLYGAGGPLDIHVYSDGEIAASQAVLSFSFLGTPMDTSNVRAFFEGGFVDPLLSELRSEQDFGGFIKQTWSFLFDFSNLSGTSSSVAFFFDSGDLANTSLDAVSVDVLAVPGPGALALLGLAGVASRRRR
ncbi:MAG: hypothetical protein CBB69_003500 [Phycisphaera sp. TMED9]|nr:MAG: hypothetical protein CBB69_003500 [Phycisphaera sp. TMED9]